MRLRRRWKGKRGARACVMAGTPASMHCNGDSRRVVLRITHSACAVGSARRPFDEMCHRPPPPGLVAQGRHITSWSWKEQLLNSQLQVRM